MFSTVEVAVGPTSVVTVDVLVTAEARTQLQAPEIAEAGAFLYTPQELLGLGAFVLRASAALLYLPRALGAGVDGH